MKSIFCVLLILFSCQRLSAAEAIKAPHVQIINADLSALWSDPSAQIWIAGGMDGTILRSTDGGLSWRQAQTEGRFHAYLIMSDKTGTLLALAEDRMLRSSDKGLSWQQIKLPENRILTSALALHNGSAWLATANDGSLLRSTDGALTWRSVKLPAGTPALMAVNENETGKLFAAGMQGTLLLSGNGLNWKAVGTGITANISRLQALPGKSGMLALWANGEVSGVDASGKLWQGQSIGPEFPTTSTYDAVGRQILVGNTQGQIWRSRDLGLSWQTSTIQERIHIAGIFADPRDGSLNVAGGRGTLARSSDGGASWQLLYGNQWTSRFNALAVGAEGQILHAAGTGGLIWRSTDRGQHWQAVQGDLKRYVREMLNGPAKDEVIAAGADGLLMHSTDTGRTWQDIPTGLPNDVSLLSLIQKGKGGTLMASGPMGSFLKSTDGGAHWQSQQPIQNAGDGYLSQIAADPDSDTLLIVSPGRLMRSADGGKKWQALTQGPESQIEQLAALGKGIFMGLSKNGQLLHSTDQGQHWQAIEGGLKGHFHVDTKALWLLGAGALRRSQDKGLSWQSVQAPKATLNFLLRTQGGSLLGFGNGGSILRSTDDGANWTQTNSGITASLRQPLQSPVSGEIFVAGREGNVLSSLDDGLSWAQLPTHTRAHLNRLWLSADGQTLIATGERIVRIELAK